MTAENNVRRESSLSSFPTSELTLKLYAVSNNLYVNVKDAENKYDARETNTIRDQGTAGDMTRDQTDDSRHNPFFFDFDEKNNDTKFVSKPPTNFNARIRLNVSLISNSVSFISNSRQSPIREYHYSNTILQDICYDLQSNKDRHSQSQDSSESQIAFFSDLLPPEDSCYR